MAHRNLLSGGVSFTFLSIKEKTRLDEMGFFFDARSGLQLEGGPHPV